MFSLLIKQKRISNWWLNIVVAAPLVLVCVLCGVSEYIDTRSCLSTVYPPRPGSSQRVSDKRPTGEDRWLWFGPGHRQRQQLRRERKRMWNSDIIILHHFLHTMWQVTWLCGPSGAFTSEVDGTREHLSWDVHHEEWRLGLRHLALGDLLTR